MASDPTGSFPENDVRESDNRAEKEIRRGVTTMKKVINARSKGIRLPVSWNDRGQVVDPNKSTFVNYIGVLARQKVPITINDWRKVSSQTKRAIWDDTTLTFDIDESRKKYVLAEAGKFARNFRSYLSRVWVRDNDGNINYNPPSQYDIPQADWTSFVDLRLSEEFQQLSRENQERAKETEYPYRSSRLGHALMEQIEMNRRRDARSDCTGVTQTLVWRITRSDKKNEINNANVRRAVNEMKNISQESTSHSRNEKSQDDLLAKALKKKKHPGRVKGVGFGVSQREYFMDPKPFKNMEMENLRNIVKGISESLASMQRRLDDLEASNSRQPHEDEVISLQDSCPEPVEMLPEVTSL